MLSHAVLCCAVCACGSPPGWSSCVHACWPGQQSRPCGSWCHHPVRGHKASTHCKAVRQADTIDSVGYHSCASCCCEVTTPLVRTCGRNCCGHGLEALGELKVSPQLHTCTNPLPHLLKLHGCQLEAWCHALCGPRQLSSHAVDDAVVIQACSAGRGVVRLGSGTAGRQHTTTVTQQTAGSEGRTGHSCHARATLMR